MSLCMLLYFLLLVLSVHPFKLPIHHRRLLHDQHPARLAFTSRGSTVIARRKTVSISPLKDSLDQLFGSEKPQLPAVNQEDVAAVASFLQNVSSALQTNPGHALTLVSQNLQWLLSRNIPKLTEEVLHQNPQMDNILGDSYAFVMDFLESVTTETSELMKRNQALMKSLFQSLKGTEQELDQFIATHVEELTSSEFMIYLQSELTNQEPKSEMHALLQTIHLRLLDECGKKWGVDVRALPRLAAEDDSRMRKEKVMQHIAGYDLQGIQLFIQTVRMMLSEIRRRYQNVDPTLIHNLEDIERIATQAQKC